MDQVSSMETFVTVVRCGSYASAAEVLGMSATMVAKHINYLESKLVAKLLNRTTRKHSLTEAGRLYYHHCIDVLDRMRTTASDIKELNAKPSGTLKITAPIIFGSECIANHIHEFVGRHPDVNIQLVLSDFVLDLVDGQYDLAFRIGDIPDSGMIARPLIPYRLVVCASPSYLAHHGQPNTPQDLELHHCLLFNYHNDLHDWVFSSKDFGSIKVNVNGNLRMNHGFALKNAAMNGAGIIIQPEILVRNELKSGALVELLKDFPLPVRPIHLIYMLDQKMPIRLREFIKFCLQKWGK